MNKNDQITHLISRNVSEIIVTSELEKKLNSGGRLTIYLGIDASGAEIHLGHAIVLWKLREFQDLGHRVILLVGDFTAQIGDPTGKSKERASLSHATVLENAKNYKSQASKILRFDGANPAELKFNSEWLDKLAFTEVVKLASNFTVQQLIERDMFQERLKAGQAIGLHEFLYPLMVGYDCVKMDVDVEVGGNDQLFNIKAGRTLMEKITGKKKVVLVCDLLTGSDGSKMSKSANNIIPIDSDADNMFGKLMAVDDELIGEYARLCSDMDDKELTLLTKRLKSSENPRNIKLDVAARIVGRYYYLSAGDKAKETWLNVFSKGSASSITIEHNQSMITLPEIVIRMDHIIKMSNSELRRLVDGRGVEIGGKTIGVVDINRAFNIGQNGLLVRIGKKYIVTIKYANKKQMK